MTDTFALSPLFQPSTQVKFTKPGVYHYFCEIHGPDMAGDIVVTS